MNIDELQPGPDLDKLVAERVMGYEVFRWGDPDSLFVASSEAAFDYACTGDTLTCHTEMGKGFCFTIPNYSTDITAAFVLIDKLERLRVWLSWRLKAERHGFHFSVSYIEPAPAIYANAPTAPLAICRAALKAVGVDKVR